MCDICGHSPCLSACPNAPEPEATCGCCACGGSIYEGDTYYDVDGNQFCSDCVWHDAARILEALGYEKLEVPESGEPVICPSCEERLEPGAEYYKKGDSIYCADCLDCAGYDIITCDLVAIRREAYAPEEDYPY